MSTSSRSINGTPDWAADASDEDESINMNKAGGTNGIEMTNFVDEHVDGGVTAPDPSNDREGLLRGSGFGLFRRGYGRTPTQDIMLRKQHRRRRTLIAVAVVLFVAGLAGSIGAAVRLRQEDQTQSVPAPAPFFVFGGTESPVTFVGIPTTTAPPEAVHTGGNSGGGNTDHSESPITQVGIPTATPPPHMQQSGGNTESPITQVGLPTSTPPPQQQQQNNDGTGGGNTDHSESPITQVGIPTATPPPHMQQTGNTESPVNSGAGISPVLHTAPPLSVPGVPSPTSIPMGPSIVGSPVRTGAPQRIPEIPTTPSPTTMDPTNVPTVFPTFSSDNGAPTEFGFVPSNQRQDNFSPTLHGDNSAAAWEPIGAVLTSVDGTTDGFGASVALSASGGRAFVGADQHATAEGARVGYAEAFAPSGGINFLRLGNNNGRLLGDAPNALFGRSVATSANGDIFVIGGSGFVDSFELVNNQWTTYADRISGLSGFGSSLSLSSDGRTLAVGNPDDLQVTIYETTESPNGNGARQWQPLANRLDFLETDETEYGRVVSLSGDGLVVCAGYVSSNLGNQFLRIFTLNEARDEWVRLGNNDLTIPDSSTVAGSSVSPALSDNGRIVAVGLASVTEPNSLSVFEYNINTAQWMPRGANLVSTDNEVTDVDFAKVVAISANGNTVAVSSSIAAGMSDHAIVFQWHDERGLWVVVDGPPPNAPIQSKERHGVALSSNGRILAVSTTDVGQANGAVQLYKLEGDA